MLRGITVPTLITIGLLALWVSAVDRVSEVDASAGPLTDAAREQALEYSGGRLSTIEEARLAQLEAKRLHELSGHSELAEMMRLRTTALRDNMPPAAEEVAHYALKAMGQPYKRRSISYDLSEADCVTFTERCIALACTRTWNEAYSLQNRLRYRDGIETEANRNREPILDWIPANEWLLQEVTGDLGAELSGFDVVFEGRSNRTFFIPKEELPKAYPSLQTGDVALFIADQPNPPSDPVSRLRCAHMAFIYKPDPTGPVSILHSYPPQARQWPLERLTRNPHVRGVKVLRIRPDARGLANTELSRKSLTTAITPADIDNRLRLAKGQFGFITASREPDSTLVIDGIQYGAVQLRPGETLWSLFKSSWKGVVALEVNRGFMARQADLNANRYEGETVYYPIQWAK